MVAAMNATQSSFSNLRQPVDATRVFDWGETDAGRRREREFVGTQRQAAGFTVSIEGVQRENGMCRRSVSVWRPSHDQRMPVQAARQLAAAIAAAADEIESLR